MFIISELYMFSTTRHALL